ncbi:unannotated protein [freshwater metagenome]|uniref:Unannotated protein n=1 Tax=freshwater metagenome TaxID=449393 RepID=A0A6J6L8K2_9ZZZZ|nr:hypothetical protein [Actinomycetota bacterium]
MSESDNWQPPVPPTFSTEYETPFQQEPRAGFGIRLLAHICDGLSSLLVALPIQLIGALVSDSSSVSDADGFAGLPGFGMGTTDIWSVIGTIASFFVLAYWIGSRGGSPLRVRLGVLVLDQNDGSFIGTRRAVYRGLMSYVSQLALLLGYLWMLWDPNKQTWHDKVAQSVVVKR